MRINVGIAVSLLVAFAIGVSTFVVHSLWWTTARGNSRMLAAEINSQIADTVQIEVGLTLRSAEAAWAAVRTIFVQNVIETRQADKRGVRLFVPTAGAAQHFLDHVRLGRWRFLRSPPPG